MGLYLLSRYVNKARFAYVFSDYFFKESILASTMEFTEKTFKIAENVSFSILMAYFDGHPIVQTKSLRLMYHGQLQEMKSGNRLYESLIPHGLQTKEALDLLNYLSRLIYAENIYEVYVNNSNQSDYVSEMKEYITHNQSVSTHGLNNRFELIEGITNISNQIDQEELNKHRNEDFPLVVHNFEEIEVAPLFTYVHPNLTINRGETVHLCHFAFLLERLSHLSAYPEFNNQAVMSLLGNVFESDESGLTVEEINKDKYEEIIEENNKLREDNKKKRDELRKLIKQNKQLIISTNDLKIQNDELKETIDEMYNMNLTSGVIIRRNENQLVKIKEAIEEVHEEVGGIKVKDRKLNKVQTITVLFTSPDKPKDKELRDHVPTGQTWIGTFNGESKYFIETGKHILYKSNSNRLDSFKSMLEHPNIAPLIREKTRYRDLLVRNEDIDALIQAVNSS